MSHSPLDRATQARAEAGERVRQVRAEVRPTVTFETEESKP